jgi:hypothetical protein
MELPEIHLQSLGEQLTPALHVGRTAQGEQVVLKVADIADSYAAIRQLQRAFDVWTTARNLQQTGEHWQPHDKQHALTQQNHLATNDMLLLLTIICFHCHAGCLLPLLGAGALEGAVFAVYQHWEGLQNLDHFFMDKMLWDEDGQLKNAGRQVGGLYDSRTGRVKQSNSIPSGKAASCC